MGTSGAAAAFITCAERLFPSLLPSSTFFLAKQPWTVATSPLPFCLPFGFWEKWKVKSVSVAVPLVPSAAWREERRRQKCIPVLQIHISTSHFYLVQCLCLFIRLANTTRGECNWIAIYIFEEWFSPHLSKWLALCQDESGMRRVHLSCMWIVKWYFIVSWFLVSFERRELRVTGPASLGMRDELSGCRSSNMHLRFHFMLLQ